MLRFLMENTSQDTIIQDLCTLFSEKEKAEDFLCCELQISISVYFKVATNDSFQYQLVIQLFDQPID